MKLFHLSDLHLGKRFKEFSLYADQSCILRQILDYARDERPDGVLLAGDIYDKSVPSAEAVGLFDGFLTELSRMGIPVFLISGNHDSPERIAFASRLLTKSGVYAAPVYDGTVAPISLTDGYGQVCLYLLPFVKPQALRHAFPEEADRIETYTDALSVAIAHMKPDFSKRNVLVTHQFVTGASGSGSEEAYVGGTENVDARVFDGFDYVALGHIHGAQCIGRETLRYCGTPMKYSFGEQSQQKSVTVVHLKEKGTVSLELLPLTPLRDMREIRGSYLQLMDKTHYEGTSTGDFIRAVLTDSLEIPDAMRRLRTVYPNLSELVYENHAGADPALSEAVGSVESMTPEELFETFYAQQNGTPMLDVQRDYIARLLDELKEEEA